MYNCDSNNFDMINIMESLAEMITVQKSKYKINILTIIRHPNWNSIPVIPEVYIRFS